MTIDMQQENINETTNSINMQSWAMVPIDMQHDNINKSSFQKKGKQKWGVLFVCGPFQDMHFLYYLKT